MTKSLIVVDVQNDFVEGGALAVAGGKEVARRISEWLSAEAFWLYFPVVATQDWHIDPGDHWSDNPNFIDSWPVHCRANTYGAYLVSYMHRDDILIHKYVRKGQYDAAYSGFEGWSGYSSLDAILKSYATTEVDVIGIAYDYCVKATALDAVRLGYKTRILTDLTVPVHGDSHSLAALEHELQTAGVELALSA